MTCWSVRNLLDLYVDGRLTASRQARLARHLDGCAACAAAVVRPVRAAAVSAPAGLAEAVKRGLRAPAPAPSWRPALAPAHALAFACLAVLALAPGFYGAPSQHGRAELGEELLP